MIDTERWAAISYVKNSMDAGILGSDRTNQYVKAAFAALETARPMSLCSPVG